MTVCKYFQSGRCKFGSRCRFEHVHDRTNQGAVDSGPSSIVAEDFGNVPMWPFSSYGCPGYFDVLVVGDLSLEEVMLEERKMKAMGLYPQHLQNIQVHSQKMEAERSRTLTMLLNGGNQPQTAFGGFQGTQPPNQNIAHFSHNSNSNPSFHMPQTYSSVQNSMDPNQTYGYNQNFKPQNAVNGMFSSGGGGGQHYVGEGAFLSGSLSGFNMNNLSSNGSVQMGGNTTERRYPISGELRPMDDVEREKYNGGRGFRLGDVPERPPY